MHQSPQPRDTGKSTRDHKDQGEEFHIEKPRSSRTAGREHADFRQLLLPQVHIHTGVDRTLTAAEYTIHTTPVSARGGSLW